jgi:hypothetical protein
MENIKLFPMFAIPLYITNVYNWKTKKDKLLGSFNNLQYITQEQKTNEYIETNFYHSDGMKEDRLNITDILSEELSEFCSNMGFREFRVRKSWVERQQQNMYHMVHNHGALGYSCICYLDYDEKIHTPVHFVSPFNNFINGEQIDFCPDNITESSLIIFPSSILHYTLPNISTSPRVAVSFNIDVRL